MKTPPSKNNAENIRTIFLCEDTPDGIFTAVYDAWASGLGHRKVALELDGCFNYSLFSRYISVSTDYEKSFKVARSLINKLSRQVFTMAYYASLSETPEKADAIYRFLILAFHHGPAIISMLGLPEVQTVFALRRRVGNEAHYFREFIRFSDAGPDLLFGKIHPKSNVLPLVAPCFSDRMPSETWLLLDEKRNLAAFHPADQEWSLTSVSKSQLEALQEHTKSEDQYRSLWKVFHKTIAIKERMNPRCQKNQLPLWYRRNMTEFPD